MGVTDEKIKESPKKKKFRPCKTFRFLPGTIGLQQNKLDLEKFNLHRWRCFTAAPIVDSSPPRMDPLDMLKMSKLRDEQARVQRIDKDNKKMLRKINTINRCGGKLKTFWTPGVLVGNWKARQNQLLHIAEMNRKIYKGIVSIQPHYGVAECKAHWDKMKKVLQHSCKLKLVLMDEINIDHVLATSPSISDGMISPVTRANRPHCFLDFKVVDGEFLGRIVVELYHEYVPVTVQNFLEICKGTSDLTYKGCPVHRIILGKFMETGDITLGTGRGGKSVYGDSFQEENHVLKHRRAGVLSMKRIQYKTENNSQFCISFRAIEELDHKNVVFGKVIRGNKTVFKIEAYGRKIGKPHADVRISNCGELKLQSSGNSRRGSSGSMAGRKRSGSMQISYEDQKQQKNTSCCTLKNCCVPNKV